MTMNIIRQTEYRSYLLSRHKIKHQHILNAVRNKTATPVHGI